LSGSSLSARRCDQPRPIKASMCAGKLAKSYARDRPNRQAREARKIIPLE
jgi:hypothetical protein